MKMYYHSRSRLDQFSDFRLRFQIFVQLKLDKKFTTTQMPPGPHPGKINEMACRTGAYLNSLVTRQFESKRSEGISVLAYGSFLNESTTARVHVSCHLRSHVSLEYGSQSD